MPPEPTTDSSDTASLVIFATIFIVATIAILARFVRSRMHGTTRGASALLTHYTRGRTLVPIAEDKLDGMHYSSYLTSSVDTLIVRVELPFATRLHLLNVPKIGDTQAVYPLGWKGNHLEEVHLEGDYHKHFALYCAQGEQAEARYVLDPLAMVHVIDFCRHFSWELVGNELYLVQDTTQAAKAEPMFAQVLPFIEQIRPALERPLTTAEQRAMTPYGRDRRSSLTCPVCQADMPNVDSHFSCPAGHGTLLTGSQLAQLKDGELQIAAQNSAYNQQRGDIPCPACGQVMHPTAYNGRSDLIIDSCTNCPYRWLDTTELLVIKG